jgi:hypothetical protein
VAGQQAPPAPPEHARRGRGGVRRDQTEHAAGTQHPRDRGQGADRVGEVLEHVDHEHGVEGVGLEAGLLEGALEHVESAVPGPSHRPVGQLDAPRAPAEAAGFVEQQPHPTADVQDQGRPSPGEIGVGRGEQLPAGRAAGILLGDVRLVHHVGVRGLELVFDHPGLENATTRAAVQLRLLARVVAGRSDLLAGGGGGRALVGQRQLGGAANPTCRGGHLSLSGRSWVESQSDLHAERDTHPWLTRPPGILGFALCLPLTVRRWSEGRADAKRAYQPSQGSSAARLLLPPRL